MQPMNAVNQVMDGFPTQEINVNLYEQLNEQIDKQQGIAAKAILIVLRAFIMR